MRTLRVCFVSLQFPPDLGGVAISAGRVVHHLAALGFQMHVFVRDNVVHSEAVSCAEGIHLHRVSRRPGALWKAIQAADEKVSFDLFHGFYLPLAAPCLRVAEQGRRPVVASIRGIDGMNIGSEVDRTILERVSWVTSVSSASLVRASKLVNITGRASLIANGVCPSSSDHWSLSPLNAGVVGTVATFRPKKNIPLLASAYAHIPRNLRSKLLLVGDFMRGTATGREEATRVQSVVRQEGIGSEIEITGVMPHRVIPEHLAKMRVFVLSSDHEGMPNAVLEAAQYGVPIVATSVDGVRDVFSNEENAILVPPGDRGRLTSAICAVLGDEALANKLSAGGRDLAARRSPEKEALEYAELYLRLSDKGKRSSVGGETIPILPLGSMGESGPCLPGRSHADPAQGGQLLDSSHLYPSELMMQRAKASLRKAFGQSVPEAYLRDDLLSPQGAVCVAVYVKGRMRGMGWGRGQTFSEQLYHATFAAARDPLRGPGILRSEVSRARLEVWVELGVQRLSISEREARDAFVIGRHGVGIRLHQSFAHMLPVTIVRSGCRTPQEAFSRTCELAGLEPTSWKSGVCDVWRSCWYHVSELSGKG